MPSRLLEAHIDSILDSILAGSRLLLGGKSCADHNLSTLLHAGISQGQDLEEKEEARRPDESTSRLVTTHHDSHMSTCSGVPAKRSASVMRCFSRGIS